MIYLGLVAGLASIAASAYLAARAFREEHLILLFWRRHGGWVLEREPDGGRYRRLSPWRLPAALLRYLALTGSWRLSLTLPRSPERALSGGR